MSTPRARTAVTAPSTLATYERFARQCIDTKYKLADGTLLSASVTAMRTDLTNLAWIVVELVEAVRAEADRG